MRERDIEARLIQRVREAGGEVRKVRWLDRRGAPDRLVLLPDGRSLWVEVKAPGRVAQAHQEREHKRLRTMGQTVVVLDSIEQIEEVLA